MPYRLYRKDMELQSTGRDPESWLLARCLIRQHSDQKSMYNGMNGATIVGNQWTHHCSSSTIKHRVGEIKRILRVQNPNC